MYFVWEETNSLKLSTSSEEKELEISDIEYDRLVEELRKIDPENELETMALLYGGQTIDLGKGGEFGMVNPLEVIMDADEEEIKRMTQGMYEIYSPEKEQEELSLSIANGIYSDIQETGLNANSKWKITKEFLEQHDFKFVFFNTLHIKQINKPDAGYNLSQTKFNENENMFDECFRNISNNILFNRSV
mgnify:CR=1 FL=1